MSRQSLLAIRRGRRAARTSTFDSKLPAFDPFMLHSKSNPNPNILPSIPSAISKSNPNPN